MNQLYARCLLVSLLLGFCASPVLADDIREDKVSAMLQDNLNLYDFYTIYSTSLDMCSAQCPEYKTAAEEGLVSLAELLDGAVASVRSKHHEQLNFAEHDSAVRKQVKQGYFSGKNICAPCEGMITQVQDFAASGLPSDISRIAMLHSEQYTLTPERLFEDGHVQSASYKWYRGGKKRSCKFNVPSTWGRVETPERQGLEYRSALGNGIPFFTVTTKASRRIADDNEELAYLSSLTLPETLYDTYGAIEVLAQGQQKLGAVQSVWVMFKTEPMSKISGYYYNWYMLVDGELLTFHSGVAEDAKQGSQEQEELFRKYYQTLREIALSSVIQ